MVIGQSPEACPITQLATWAAVQRAAASKARTHVVRRRHFNLCSRPKSPVTASPPPPRRQTAKAKAAVETDGDNRFCISILPSFLSFYLSLSFAPSLRPRKMSSVATALHGRRTRRTLFTKEKLHLGLVIALTWIPLYRAIHLLFSHQTH